MKNLFFVLIQLFPGRDYFILSSKKNHVFFTLRLESSVLPSSLFYLEKFCIVSMHKTCLTSVSNWSVLSTQKERAKTKNPSIEISSYPNVNTYFTLIRNPVGLAIENDFNLSQSLTLGCIHVMQAPPKIEPSRPVLHHHFRPLRLQGDEEMNWCYKSFLCDYIIAQAKDIFQVTKVFLFFLNQALSTLLLFNLIIALSALLS